MDNPRLVSSGESACHLDCSVNSFADLDSPARETLA
jgi:hypothetical protein